MILNKEIFKYWKSRTILEQLVVLMIGLLSLFSLVIILYINLIAEKKVEQKLIINEQNELKKQVQYVNTQFKQLELFCINWGLRIKKDIEEVLEVEGNLNYDNTETIRKDLASLEVGNLLIQEAFIYIDTKVPYSIKTGETWKENNNQQDRFFFKNFDKNNEISWKRIETDSGSKLIFSYRISSQNEEIQKNLVVVLNNQEINNIIGVDKNNVQESIIVKNNTYILTSSEKIANNLKEIREEIKKSKNNILEVEKEEWIFYEEEAQLFSESWNYIMLMPIKNVKEQYKNTFRNISLYIIFLNLVASILINISLKKIYVPIEYLFNLFKRSDNIVENIKSKNDIEYITLKWKAIKAEKRELERTINYNNQLLVKNLLKQLIQNGQLEENDFIENKMNSLGWELENKKILLIDFLLTDRFRKDINLAEDESLSYAVSEKIIKENIYEIYKNITPNLTVMTPKGILSILVLDNESYTIERKKLINLTHNILKQINHQVEKNIVITISKEFDHYSQITSMYKKMREFRDMRNVGDTNIILDMKRAGENISRDMYIYPIEFEKDIIQGIYLNDENVILKGLDDFGENIKSQEIKIDQMRSVFLQMLNNLRYEIIQRGYGSERIIKEIDNSLSKLDRCEYTEQVKSLIWINILKPLLDDQKENNRGEEKNYINKVLYLIRNHYQEEDFSLVWCAKQIEIDEFILSKIFKKNVGINFIDYLTKVRLDKAMELLVTTNYPVITIAQMVGYQGNYFSRIFKAKTGKTPGEYRKDK